MLLVFQFVQLEILAVQHYLISTVIIVSLNWIFCNINIVRIRIFYNSAAIIIFIVVKYTILTCILYMSVSVAKIISLLPGL